jgi:hypothetical protein
MVQADSEKSQFEAGIVSYHRIFSIVDSDSLESQDSTNAQINQSYDRQSERFTRLQPDQNRHAAADGNTRDLWKGIQMLVI